MGFNEIMHGYFRAERLSSLALVVPVGALLIAFAAVVLRADTGAFARAVAIPLLLFGLFGVGAGASVGLRAPAQASAIEAQYAKDPSGLLATELPRMEKVNANWPRLIGTWTALILLALGLHFGLPRADWAQGLAPALLVIGAIGFMVDGFAERRARPYTEALRAIASPPR